MKKRVIARLLLNEASLASFKFCADKILEKSRKEDGNVSYNLYQNFSRKSEFLFVEIYKDQEALDTHFNSEHLKLFLSEIKSYLLKEPVIEIDAVKEYLQI
ncbi:putative quinol monooxygenase [Parafilimonas sp.]|uniref:putative quinol monooxygenase n=1 Tax=Parafilimonas sp. TaxID=1969739 RepID=UPI003F7FAF83